VLLQRCLQKDPKQRLQAIGDARIALDEVIAGPPEDAALVAAVTGAVKKPWGMWLLGGCCGRFDTGRGFASFSVLSSESACGPARAPATEPPAPSLVAGVFFGRMLSVKKQMATYSTPEQIAEVVYEAATDGKDQLRYVAGTDAKTMYDMRLQMGDEAFRKAIDQQFFGQQRVASP